MIEFEYTVLVEGNPVATCCGLEYAMMFAKSLFEEYYAEPNLTIEIHRRAKS